MLFLRYDSPDAQDDDVALTTDQQQPPQHSSIEQNKTKTPKKAKKNTVNSQSMTSFVKVEPNSPGKGQKRLQTDDLVQFFKKIFVFFNFLYKYDQY